jgi:hypothetical protein
MNDKAHVHLIMLLSMCAGAKGDWAKHIAKREPSKRIWKAAFSSVLKDSILFLKLSIGTTYYQGELWSTSVDMVVVLKRTHKNHKKPSQHSKRNCLWNSMSNPKCPGLNPECPDRMSGVSGRIPGVSGLLLPACKTRLVRSLRTPMSGVSGHIPGVSGYCSPNG